MDHVGIGHNSQLQSRVDEIVSAANKWTKAPIDDQDQADFLSGFIDQIRSAAQEVETARKEAKQPHMDAGAAVDAKFKPLSTLLETAKGLVMPKLTAWLQKLEGEKRERERLAREEAEKLAAAAEAARKAAVDAVTGEDAIQAAVHAEIAAEVAAKAAKNASKIAAAPVNLQSAIGARTKTLIKTSWHATVTSVVKASQHYRSHPDLLACLKKLAEADARHGVRDIPGVTLYSEQTAV